MRGGCGIHKMTISVLYLWIKMTIYEVWKCSVVVCSITFSQIQKVPKNGFSFYMYALHNNFWKENSNLIYTCADNIMPTGFFDISGIFGIHGILWHFRCSGIKMFIRC